MSPDKSSPLLCIAQNTEHQYTIDRVVGTSKFQITKPDALFVVFLGIKWAYDFVKKIGHEFMGIFGPETLALLRGKTVPNEPNFNFILEFSSSGAVSPLKKAKISGPSIPMNSCPIC